MYHNNSRLSYISEGFEEDDDRNDPLETVLEDDDMTARSSGAPSRGAGREYRNSIFTAATQRMGPNRGGHSSSIRSANSSLRSSLRSTSTSSSRTSKASRLSQSLLSSGRSAQSAHSNSTGMSSSVSVSTSHVSNASSPLIFTQHSLSQQGTREINIHDTPFFAGMDESLPDEYSDASLYDHELIFPHQEELSVDDEVSMERGNDEIRMLPQQYYFHKQTQSSHRRAYAMVTIAAALSLSVAGVVFAAQVLATASPQSIADKLTSSNKDATYFYMPRYEFGGTPGGLSQGYEAEEMSRRATMTRGADTTGRTANLHEEPKLVPLGTNPDNVMLIANIERTSSSLRAPQSTGSSSRTPQSTGKDPFHGFGPPQFNPAFNTRESSKVTLTSTPLTSYNPPEAPLGDIVQTVVIDPMFHGAMLDVSVLPFQPQRELPVFWEIPMTGAERIKYALGSCLKLVECSDIGKELLMREYKESEIHAQDSTLMLDGAPPDFDPPLKTSYIHASTSVNVDCSTPTGIDRAISHDLAASKMIDVMYTPDMHDAARMFAPPTEAYGRGMVVMRHPVERVVAQYEYLRLLRDGSGVGSMTLDQFANSRE